MNNREKSQNSAKFGLYGLVLAMIVTVAIMIYAAHPWGENYANQTLTDYVYLVAFSFWSIVPYLALMIFIHLFRDYKLSHYVVNGGTGLIILASLVFLIDSVFIHPDVQGAHIFLFLPIYQWLAILLLGIIAAIVFQLNKKSATC
jgi:hypothetical protein